MNKHMAAGTGAYAAGYLDDSFLDRVRAGYRLALGSVGMNTSSMWRLISQRQAPVHAALMAEGNDQLRRIFIDPSSVDLFYGVDNISRSILAKWDAASVSDVGASARADLFVWRSRSASTPARNYERSSLTYCCRSSTGC
jgi:hypothetical protein